MFEEYPALTVTPRSGNELFHSDGKPVGTQLADFWRWAFSDLASNATRGIFAEYLGTSALGVARDVRKEWDSCDIIIPPQSRIEVKSAAYLQSWSHKKLSSIAFSISPTSEPQNDNTRSYERNRQNDLYVFCLLHHTDKATLDPLNLDQWSFYVLPTRILNEKLSTQKSLRLSVLQALNPRICKFEGLAHSILSISDRERDTPLS